MGPRRKLDASALISLLHLDIDEPTSSMSKCNRETNVLGTSLTSPMNYGDIFTSKLEVKNLADEVNNLDDEVKNLTDEVKDLDVGLMSKWRNQTR